MAKQYAENTIKRYNIAIGKLRDAGFKDFTADADKVVKYIMGASDKFNTRKSFISAVMYTYDNKADIPEIYRTAIKKEFELMNKHTAAQELTPEQDENYLDWPVIMELQKELKNKKDKNAAQELAYLVVSLYTLTSPVRSDYGRMQVVTKYKKTGNLFVNAKSPYFVFREYKTSKTYGETKVKCPVALKNVIRRYFEVLGETPEFLLGKEYDPIVLSNYVRAVFQRYLGKAVGINLLRHSYITYMNDKGKLRTTKQKKETARKMLHSVAKQGDYDLPKKEAVDSDKEGSVA